MRVIFVVLGLSILVSGCAVGVKHNYDLPGANLSVETSESVAIAVQDRRDYVVAGNKDQDFVGLSRGGFGNPFDITTESGKPLAADMTATIAAGLTKKNIAVEKVLIEPGDSSEKVLRKLLSAKKSRSILVTLKKWKSDTYVYTSLSYDILIQIFGNRGDELARKFLQGKDDLGVGDLSSVELAKERSPKLFKAKIEALFANPGIAAALR